MTASASEDFFFARQPILDRTERIVAYELLFRSGQGNFAEVSDDVHATSSVIVHAFSDMGIGATLGKCRGFLNFNADLLMSDIVAALPKDQVVIEVLETVDVTDDIITRCKELRQMGFVLALDDFAGMKPEYEPLMPLLSVVKFELPAFSQTELGEMVPSLRRWPVRLLAEKVDSRQQVQECKDLGFDLFQGYYFARPTVMTGKQAEMSSQILLRVLSAVVHDAETIEIEQLLKHDAGLTHRLLRLVNSAASGLSNEVSSLRQGIVVLGREQLKRWLQLMMFVQENASGTGDPLLNLAATRGRFMELLAKIMRKSPLINDRGLEERAFLVGVTSLLDAVLSIPMDQIAEQLHLDQEIRSALLRREGLLGAALALTEHLEQDDYQGVTVLLPQLPGVELSSLAPAQLEAMAWAGAVEEVDPSVARAAGR